MSPSTARRHLLAVWTAVFVTVLWSSSWVLIRIGLDDESLPPITFAGLRYSTAAVVLIIWVSTRPSYRHEITRLDRVRLRRLAILGITLYAVTQGAQFVALAHQPAATTSLWLSFTPFAVAAIGARSLGEVASRSQLLGAGLVAGGALLYFAGDLGATTTGTIAALVALGANSSSSVLGRRTNRHQAISPVVVATVSMAIGATALLITGLVIDGWPHITDRATLVIGWLAVINTAVAFTLWNFSLRHLSALESAGINNTMLIQIALLAWVFLDEHPGIAGIAGILTVTIGIYLTRDPTRRRSTPARPPATG